MNQNQEAIVTHSLNSEQLAAVDRVRKSIPLEGVMVGVLPGPGVNEVKPLVLVDRQLYLLRLVDGISSVNESFILELEKHAGALNYTFCELEKGQLRYARPYYQNVLLDGPELFQEWSETDVQVAIENLLNSFIAAMRSGLAHGHIWAGNLALNDKKIILLDYASSLAKKNLAKTSEIQLADLQSLARVLKEFVPLKLLVSIEGALNACFHNDGDVTEVITKVEQALTISKKSESGIINADTIKSGRLLPKSVRETPQPEQIKIESQEETVARVRGTSSLSSEVVESIRLAVAEELKSFEKSKSDDVTHATRGAELIINSPEPSVPTPNLQIEKVSEHYQPSYGNFPQSSTQHNSLMDFLLTIAVLIGLSAVGWLIYERWFQKAESFYHDPAQPVPYASYWSSQLSSRMQVVAKLAVEGDSEAELTIIKSALKGDKLSNVRGNILQIAFNSAWEHELSKEDRKLALTLGLSDLLGKEVGPLPLLENSHPGVILAAIVNLPLQGDVGSVGQIPLRALSPLPGNFRQSLAELESLGVNNFSDVSARALVRILLGFSTPDVLATFLGSGDDLIQVISRLRILSRLFPGQEQLLEQTVAAIKQNSGALSDLWEWFAADKLGLWEEVTASDKIAVLVGMSPSARLIPAQLADLFTFPAPHVSGAALVALLGQKSFAQQQETLSYLANQAQKFSRGQLVSLVSALADTDLERQESLIASWFKTEPDAQLIAELVAVRAAIKTADIFSLEAARYLKEREWLPSLEMLKIYTHHNELLVRALAYSKLQTNKPEELALLKAAIVVEPNENLKKQLELKVGEGQ